MWRWYLLHPVALPCLRWRFCDRSASDPRIHDRKNRMFRTNKFNLWKKCSFDSCNSCKRLFQLFHVANSSVLNFRFFLLLYPRSVLTCGRYWSQVAPLLTPGQVYEIIWLRLVALGPPNGSGSSPGPQSTCSSYKSPSVTILEYDLSEVWQKQILRTNLFINHMEVEKAGTS